MIIYDYYNNSLLANFLKHFYNTGEDNIICGESANFHIPIIII